MAQNPAEVGSEIFVDDRVQGWATEFGGEDEVGVELRERLRHGERLLSPFQGLELGWRGIPRALPWAISFCAFGAGGAFGARVALGAWHIPRG